MMNLAARPSRSSYAMDLGPYFVPAGRLVSAATVLLPTLAIYALYTARKGADLEDKVAVTPRLRVTLLAHAAYFSALPLMFEGGLDVAESIINQVGLSIGSVPDKPDNLFHQMYGGLTLLPRGRLLMGVYQTRARALSRARSLSLARLLWIPTKQMHPTITSSFRYNAYYKRRGYRTPLG